MTIHLRKITALLLFLFLVGCGQSGPLYIPGNPSTVQPPAEQPAAEEEDDENTEESASR